MLYNQKWDNPPRDILSLNSLIDWLGTKSGSYTYTSPSNCLLCQYFKDMGIDIVAVDTVTYTFRDKQGVLRQFKLPYRFNDIALWGSHGGTGSFEHALNYAKIWLGHIVTAN
jgi:hypothetical protein